MDKTSVPLTYEPSLIARRSVNKDLTASPCCSNAVWLSLLISPVLYHKEKEYGFSPVLMKLSIFRLLSLPLLKINEFPNSSLLDFPIATLLPINFPSLSPTKLSTFPSSKFQCPIRLSSIVLLGDFTDSYITFASLSFMILSYTRTSSISPFIESGSFPPFLCLPINKLVNVSTLLLPASFSESNLPFI